MRRSKKILILLAVLIVVSVAAVAAMQMEEKQEQIRNSDEVVLEIDPETVTSLSWEYEDVSLAFHKDETWLYDEDEAFPVDEETIGELLSLFEAFGVSFIIEEVEDYAQYGLEEPHCTIQVNTEDTEYVVTLGDYSKMDEQRYVSIGDGNVYLVSTDPMETYEKTLSDMIDNDDIPELDQITSVEFSGDQSYTITYEEDSRNSYSDADVYFTDRDGETVPMDTSRVNSYLYDIETMDMSTYATYNATQEELERFGLDDPDLTATVDYTYTVESENEDQEPETASDTFVLHISRDPEEKAAAEAAEQEQDDAEDAEDGEDTEETITAYARVGDSQIVYQLTEEDYTALTAAAYDDLRHQEVFWADFADVTQIDITLENSSYTVALQQTDEESQTEDEDEEEASVWLCQEEEVAIDDLENAILKLEAQSFTMEKPTGKEEIRLTIHLNNEDFPEVEVILYRYDGEYCVAEVAGEPVCLVLRSDVVDLVEAVNAIVLS